VWTWEERGSLPAYLIDLPDGTNRARTCDLMRVKHQYGSLSTVPQMNSTSLNRSQTTADMPCCHRFHAYPKKQLYPECGYLRSPVPVPSPLPNPYRRPQPHTQPHTQPPTLNGPIDGAHEPRFSFKRRLSSHGENLLGPAETKRYKQNTLGLYFPGFWATGWMGRTDLWPYSPSYSDDGNPVAFLGGGVMMKEPRSLSITFSTALPAPIRA